MPPQGGRKHPHQDFIQIDTTNILFICGGAFDGLEKIVEERVGKRPIGFGSEGGMSRADRAKIIEKLMPEDLLKYGLIPEFIGRLPVIVTLSPLTADDLMRVLVEPKNAVTRQFQKFLQLDKVELVFTDGALKAAAEVALDRKTGARALRSIVEEALLEVMFDIPERTDVRKCIITEETIRERRAPLLLTKSDVDKGVDETNYAELLAARGESDAAPDPRGQARTARGAPRSAPDLGGAPTLAHYPGLLDRPSHAPGSTRGGPAGREETEPRLARGWAEPDPASEQAARGRREPGAAARGRAPGRASREPRCRRPRRC